MAIFYIDPLNGLDTNDGLSWATAWKTITAGATAARIAPGDTIRIAKSSDPASLGVNATWTDGSATVTLASALTATIDRCEAAWTASANVTRSSSTTRTEGSYSESLAIAAAFATGKIAYKTITSTNFSAYSAITFTIRTSVAIASGVLRVDLCSDTAGDVVVDSFTISALSAVNTSYYLRIPKDGGGTLGTAIQSIALYAVSDPGIPTIIIDNFEACNAFSLESAIGKNTSGETFWSIQSIVGTTVTLGGASAAASGRLYSGTTETVLAYRREGFKLTPATTSTAAVETIQDEGTSGNLITFSGGWNTATTVQDGETWYFGQNSYGYGLYASSKNYIALEKIGMYLFYYGFYFVSALFWNVTDLKAAGNAVDGIVIQGGSTYTWNGVCYSVGNYRYGLYMLNSSHNHTFATVKTLGNASYGTYITNCANFSFTSLVSNRNGSWGIYFVTLADNYRIQSLEAKNNVTYGLSLAGSRNGFIANATLQNHSSYGLYSIDGSDVLILNLVTSGNTSGGVIIGYARVYLKNASIAETTEFATTYGKVYSDRHDQIAGSYKFQDGIIRGETDTTTFKTTAPSLRLYPNQASGYSFQNLPSGVKATSGVAITISVWFRKNTAYTGSQPRLRAINVSGVEKIATMTAAADIWEQLSVSFSVGEIAENQVLDVFFDVNGTAGSAFVDDLAVA